MTRAELVEALSAKEHESWSRFTEYLFSTCKITRDGEAIIPAELSLRWRRQCNTAYANLSEREKQSDRDEVAKILPLIDTYAANLAAKGVLDVVSDGIAYNTQGE